MLSRQLRGKENPTVNRGAGHPAAEREGRRSSRIFLSPGRTPKEGKGEKSQWHHHAKRKAVARKPPREEKKEGKDDSDHPNQ